MGIEQMVHGGVTDHEGQSIGHFEALLTERAFVAFTRNAEGGLVNQLQGHSGFYMTGGFAGPAGEQVPSTQAQVFGHKEPGANEVAGNLVTQ